MGKFHSDKSQATGRKILIGSWFPGSPGISDKATQQQLLDIDQTSQATPGVNCPQLPPPG